jgi:hypothetical protein
MRYVALVTILVSMLAAPAQAAPLLAKLTMHISDLPAGSTLTREATADVAHLPAGAERTNFLQLGEVGLDGCTFAIAAARGTSITLSTLLMQFTSAAKAHAMYQRVAQVAVAPLRAKTTLLKVDGTGDEGLGLSDRTSRGEGLKGGSAVLFRRGTYVFVLTIAGTTQTFSGTQAVRLAKIVDTRIRHAQ